MWKVPQTSDYSICTRHRRRSVQFTVWSSSHERSTHPNNLRLVARRPMVYPLSRTRTPPPLPTPHSTHAPSPAVYTPPPPPQCCTFSRTRGSLGMSSWTSGQVWRVCLPLDLYSLVLSGVSWIRKIQQQRHRRQRLLMSYKGYHTRRWRGKCDTIESIDTELYSIAWITGLTSLYMYIS